MRYHVVLYLFGRQKFVTVERSAKTPIEAVKGVTVRLTPTARAIQHAIEKVK